jgi:hypothetical protein
MAFIDIFNFKKYFLKPSDSQVARYGHINALYTDLSETISQNQITTDIVNQSAADASVTINAKAGKIDLGGLVTFGNPNTFTVNNSEVTANSIILVTFQAEATSNAWTRAVTVTINTVIDGSFNVCVKPATAIEDSGTQVGILHFLIIN